MTIAIGLLAKDGLVMAADTQEIIGSTKTDESKLLIANRGLRQEKAGAIAVSGSGWSGHLDTINQEMCQLFLTRKRWTSEGIAAALKKKVKDFYLGHVSPFGNFPDHDRPDYTLVIAAQPNKDRLLFTSEKSTLRFSTKYTAVGLGQSHARALMRQYWTSMDATRAASLAAYVMFHVKRNVDGCGNQTQVVVIKDAYAQYISQENIDLLEYSFDQYAAYETLMAHFILGLDLTESKIEHELEKFGARLKKLRVDIHDAQRFHMTGRRAGVRPVDQPEITLIKPLASRKSEPEQ